VQHGRPGEARGRAGIAAACLLAIAGILSCKPRPAATPAAIPPAAAQMAACRAMCSPLVVDGWFEHRVAADGRDLGAACVCAEPPAGSRL